MLFPLTTFAFVGKFIFTESMYVNHSGFSGDVSAYTKENAGDWSNVMNQIGCVFIFYYEKLWKEQANVRSCRIILVSWLGDVVMVGIHLD